MLAQIITKWQQRFFVLLIHTGCIEKNEPHDIPILKNYSILVKIKVNPITRARAMAFFQLK